MSLALVEEIEQLSNCNSHQECAAWLLTCPLMKLAKYEVTIKNRLRIKGFLIGVDYLDAVLLGLRSPRQGGFYPTDEATIDLGNHIWSIAQGGEYELRHATE